MKISIIFLVILLVFNTIIAKDISRIVVVSDYWTATGFISVRNCKKLFSTYNTNTKIMINKKDNLLLFNRALKNIVLKNQLALKNANNTIANNYTV